MMSPVLESFLTHFNVQFLPSNVLSFQTPKTPLKSDTTLYQRLFIHKRLTLKLVQVSCHWAIIRLLIQRNLYQRLSKNTYLSKTSKIVVTQVIVENFSHQGFLFEESFQNLSQRAVCVNPRGMPLIKWIRIFHQIQIVGLKKIRENMVRKKHNSNFKFPAKTMHRFFYHQALTFHQIQIVGLKIREKIFRKKHN